MAGRSCASPLARASISCGLIRGHLDCCHSSDHCSFLWSSSRPSHLLESPMHWLYCYVMFLAFEQVMEWQVQYFGKTLDPALESNPESGPVNHRITDGNHSSHRITASYSSSSCCGDDSSLHYPSCSFSFPVSLRPELGSLEEQYILLGQQQES